jgi:hypothetical protein
VLLLAAVVVFLAQVVTILDTGTVQGEDMIPPHVRIPPFL